jgi:hypothetical protein
MNNKGNMFGVGTIIVLFVAIVFVMALLSGGIYENIGRMTLTENVVNQTVSIATSPIVLRGRAVSSVVVTNASAGYLIASANYSIVNNDVSTGTLRAYLSNSTWNTGATTTSVNVSYTYQPLTYADDAGSRSMISLIAIFAAIAVISVIIWKIYEDGGLDWF